MSRKMFTKKALRTASLSVTWIHVWALTFMQLGTFSGPRLPETHFNPSRVACSSLLWYLRGQRASSVAIHLQRAQLTKGVTFWWPEVVSTKEGGNQAVALIPAVYPPRIPSLSLADFHLSSWTKRKKDWRCRPLKVVYLSINPACLQSLVASLPSYHGFT